MKYLNVANTLQVKFNQKLKKFGISFSRPEQKFLKEITYGILNTGTCIIRRIAQSLDSSTTVKKVCERLTTHLTKESFDKKLSDNIAIAQSKKLKENSLIIIDPSDIAKEYAKASEGLCKIHDASKNKTTNGYRILNIVGYNQEHDANEIIPLISEIHSTDFDLDTFKNKLLFSLEDLIIYSNNRATHVLDREFDDKVIYKFYSENETPNIIRAKKNRDLFIGSQKKNIHAIANSVSLSESYLDGKKTLYGGFVDVEIPVDPQPRKKNPTHVKAQLVVGRIKNKNGKYGGVFYFLCGNLKEKFQTAKEFLTYVLQSYRARWKIEEYHRQIKQDFAWEDIKLQRYQRIKTMNTMLHFAMVFIYEQIKLKDIFIREVPDLILDKRKISSLPKFLYYRISKVVNTIFKVIRIRIEQPIYFNREYEQILIPGF